MKNLIKLFTVVLLVSLTSSFAQQKVETFKITPDGFNGYVVKSFDGKSETEIYNSIKKWAEYNINNSSESKNSDIVNEYIGYDIIVKNGIVVKQMGTYIKWDVKFNIKFRIKGDKVRFDVNITSMKLNNPTRYHKDDFYFKADVLNWSFFKNNGKPKKNTKDARDTIEIIANGLVNGVSDTILGVIKSDTDWD